MTEAAIFTIGYGKIRPLADYQSRSRLFIFPLKFQTLILFVDSSSSKLKNFLEIRIAMKYEIKMKFVHVFFKKRLAYLHTVDFSFF